MAGLAIPIIVLGSIFILSEQEKKDSAKNSALQEVDNTRKLFLNNSNNNSSNSNSSSEGFSNNVHGNNRFSASAPSSANTYNSDAYNNSNNSVNLLSGQQTTAQQFQHNNMQPYYGARVRGPSVNTVITESILDNKQGAGSQNYSKAEIAPLFRPDEN